MRLFEITLTNNANIVMDYRMSMQYSEPLALINNQEFSWWNVVDLRNCITSYMDLTLTIHNIVFTKETLEELYQFGMKCEKEIDKQVQNEEEEYNRSKES